MFRIGGGKTEFWHCSQIEVVCGKAVGRLGADPFHFDRAQIGFYRRDYGLSDFNLQHEDIGQIPVISVSPDVSPYRGFDQLTCDPNPTAGLPINALYDRHEKRCEIRERLEVSVMGVK